MEGPLLITTIRFDRDSVQKGNATMMKMLIWILAGMAITGFSLFCGADVRAGGYVPHPGGEAYWSGAKGGVSHPYGSVQWGKRRGKVRFPYGNVRWKRGHGSVNVGGVHIKW